MTAKLLRFHDEAREKFCAGFDTRARAVRVTLGPKGRLVMLGRPYGAPAVTNSGVIVAKEIELEDPFENLGAQMAREVAAKTSETAGDGTTTATVLALAIVKEGMKFVAAGLDPMDLKRGIDAAVDAAVAELKRSSRPGVDREPHPHHRLRHRRAARSAPKRPRGAWLNWRLDVVASCTAIALIALRSWRAERAGHSLASK